MVKKDNLSSAFLASSSINFLNELNIKIELVLNTLSHYLIPNNSGDRPMIEHTEQKQFGAGVRLTVII